MKSSAIILAGGKNIRLGRNKAAECIGGKTILERVVERVSPLADQILIVSSAERTQFEGAGDAEILADAYPGCGPMGGIYTGLARSKSEYCITVACDMPFLNTALLAYMLKQASGYDAAVPRIDGGLLEPLHAIYGRSCLRILKPMLDRQELGLYPLIRALNVRYIEMDEIHRIDPEKLSFFNINYQRDVDKALEIEAKRQP